MAVNLQVSASTQNKALSALLFLYRELLERDLALEGLVRARTKRRLPVVMTIEEVRAVLEQLDGMEALGACRTFPQPQRPVPPLLVGSSDRCSLSRA